MKSVETQISEVVANLRASGHTAFVDETMRQDAGKNLERKLAKLTEFAESNGARADEKDSHNKLVEAAQKAFGMTKEEAERFARPTGSSVEPKWADLLKETK